MGNRYVQGDLFTNMIKIIKRSGLLIPKEYQYEEWYIKIREFLERRSKEYNSSVFTLHKFYVESEKFLLIPRNFPIQQFIFNYEIQDVTHEGEDIDIHRGSSLRITVLRIPEDRQEHRLLVVRQLVICQPESMMLGG